MVEVGAEDNEVVALWDIMCQPCIIACLPLQSWYYKALQVTMSKKEHIHAYCVEHICRVHIDQILASIDRLDMSLQQKSGRRQKGHHAPTYRDAS